MIYFLSQFFLSIYLQKMLKMNKVSGLGTVHHIRVEVGSIILFSSYRSSYFPKNMLTK